MRQSFSCCPKWVSGLPCDKWRCGACDGHWLGGGQGIEAGRATSKTLQDEVMDTGWKFWKRWRESKKNKARARVIKCESSADDWRQSSIGPLWALGLGSMRKGNSQADQEGFSHSRRAQRLRNHHCGTEYGVPWARRPTWLECYFAQWLDWWCEATAVVAIRPKNQRAPDQSGSAALGTRPRSPEHRGDCLPRSKLVLVFKLTFAVVPMLAWWGRQRS